jgi:hypothetical protein
VLRAKKAEEVKRVGGKAIHRAVLVPRGARRVNAARGYDLMNGDDSNVQPPTLNVQSPGPAVEANFEN